MTTIVAVRDGKRTWIGSDTQSTDNDMVCITGPKWVSFGGWAVGVAGVLRTFNLCQYHAKRLFDDLSEPLEFTERLRAMLGDYAYDVSAEKGEAPVLNGGMILASPRGIWSVCCSLSVAECQGSWADGSGRRFALGAMYAMRAVDDAERTLRAGLGAAMEYDTFTGGEIWTDVLE